MTATARPDERTIDGIRLIANRLPVLMALPLGVRLGRIVSPLIAAAKSIDLRKMRDVGKLDAEALAGALERAFSVMSERDGELVTKLVKDLLQATTAHDGKEFVKLNSDDTINRVFADKPGALIKTAAWSVELNFSGFFSALPALAPDAGESDTAAGTTST